MKHVITSLVLLFIISIPVYAESPDIGVPPGPRPVVVLDPSTRESPDIGVPPGPRP